MTFQADLRLLFELGSLRNIQRGWRQYLGTDCATVLEHSYRVALLALVIARHEEVRDEEAILKMALLHDIAEARVSDHAYVSKYYVEEHEDEALGDALAGSVFEQYRPIIDAYDRRDSAEAKIVKDADNLDVDLEMRELAARGVQLPTGWQENRRMIRDEKLYTTTAKKMWDEIQTADPAEWHLAINKWNRVPSAGR